VDTYVCPYHDQALIPLKALAFDAAVNTTLGLPVPRTSGSRHGLRHRLAGQGQWQQLGRGRGTGGPDGSIRVKPSHGSQHALHDFALVHLLEGFVPFGHGPDAADDRLHIELTAR